MPRFPRTSVRPIALRPLLRELHGHGERVVAWGAAEQTPDGAMRTLRLGLGMAPGMGPALAEILMRPRRFVLVLTDARLLTLRASSARRSGVVRAMDDQPVAMMRVRRTGRWAVMLDGQGSRPALRLEILRSKGRAPARLMEALALLGDERSGA